MTVFYLDTSALVKRYKTEEGSDIIDYLYDNLPRGHSLATSFLTVLEFVSAIRRLLKSVVTLPLGFIITVLLGRYLGAGDLGLYRMTSTIYGIAMLVAAIGIPAAMIKYVAEFKNDKTSGVITSQKIDKNFFKDVEDLKGLLKWMQERKPYPFVIKDHQNRYVWV